MGLKLLRSSGLCYPDDGEVFPASGQLLGLERDLVGERQPCVLEGVEIQHTRGGVLGSRRLLALL